MNVLPLQPGLPARRGQRLGSFTFPVLQSADPLSAAFQAHDPARGRIRLRFSGQLWAAGG